jgi:serine/threonine protein kinase
MGRMIFHPGQRVSGERGDVLVLEWVGEGSYARVYKGAGNRGPGLGRSGEASGTVPPTVVALKLAKAEVDGAVSRLERERAVLDSLAHPAVPALRDLGALDGVPWLALDWIEGESLRQRLDRQRSLPLVQAVPMLLRIADAVAALHAAGWSHGDLRPDNIRLESGIHPLRGYPQPFLLDFGEAWPVGSAVEEKRGRRTRGIGTAPNVPGPVCEDLRRLGQLLAWSLTGVDPEIDPDRLSPARGHHGAVVQLWQQARGGHLHSAVEYRDALKRLAHALGR